MTEQHWRVWFGDNAASEEQLRRIEEIQVTQEMDACWEAQLRMVLCLDENGVWLHWPGDSSALFSRVRVEIDIGNGRFVPLIDGPLVSVDAALDSQPGRSAATLVVRDDSAFLNRDEETEAPFEHRKASDIATELFGRFEQIGDTRIDATQASPQTTTRRGTVLQFLRELAKANDRHAYVLPGDRRGASIGCFLADPADAAGLPPLVLVGESRNLTNASVMQDPEGGERTQAQVLRVDDQGVTHFETSAADLGLMRTLPALPADLTPRRLLNPSDNTREDPASAATAQARRNGYIYVLTSQVIPGCYGGLLTPYQKVRVDVGATPYSGDYLITKVVHRITPSLYTQELEAKTDSVTEVSEAAVAEALGGGLQWAVSVNGGIF
ncbi:hypothetical protein SAMN05660489_02912 [Pseudomonas sp. LAMO17WK12:I10]|uniref:hypothetical protein n=1 Tax=unclassified Pseudomonas TaxID=196821 RepID=UPI000BC6FBBE|nr:MULTISPECIES: hypothetical protein [unclassified Pseudomonas]PXX69512.1 hypothetical protein H160_02997 [Pseudomonas sp. LAMO17WK12:I9]SNY32944.1 hypothetical protein SAMN05660489_02912 [Pseudomonas sp. LAMO17WK12:I10]